MEEMKFCESCGMPLDNEEVIGTNKDGGKNNDYCVYCYKDGTFTSDSTMEEMIETSLNHMKESGILEQQGKTEEEVRQFMYSFFPKLKRWNCTCTDECASGYNPNCTCTNPECHCRESN